MEETVSRAIIRAGKQFGEAPALREKVDGSWTTTSWRDYIEASRSVGLGLLALGLEPQDRVCILAGNSPRWLHADMGIIGVGGVSVGIYATNAPVQVAHVIRDCGARFIFVEDQAQLDKVAEQLGELPDLVQIIVFEKTFEFADEKVAAMPMRQLSHFGARIEPGRWEECAKAVKSTDLALLIYTSGTTGPPKGAMLSHQNVMFQMQGQDKTLPIGPADAQISFLPFSHIGERLLGAFRPLMGGSAVSFVESPLTIAENIREVAPTLFFGVPRLWEKFHDEIIGSVLASSPLRRMKWRLAMAVGRRIARCKLAEREPSLPLRSLFWISDALALDEAKRLVGLHRTGYVICGGAPTSPELIEWFLALGIDMRQTYGLTESTGVVSVPPVGKNRIGTTGQAFPGSQVRIAGDGEILVQGGNVFQGYYNSPEKTAEVLKDDWLYTGDIGALDNDGYLTILGRKKDIIITAGGKNVSPSEIETQLKFSPLIAEAMVVGDGRKYLTGLIIIDFENVSRQVGGNGRGFAEVCNDKKVAPLIQGEIDAANTNLSTVEQIKKFRLIDQPLNPQDEALTPTMKLKRHLFEERYRGLIETMYDEG